MRALSIVICFLMLTASNAVARPAKSNKTQKTRVSDYKALYKCYDDFSDLSAGEFDQDVFYENPSGKNAYVAAVSLAPCALENSSDCLSDINNSGKTPYLYLYTPDTIYKTPVPSVKPGERPFYFYVQLPASKLNKNFKTLIECNKRCTPVQSMNDPYVHDKKKADFKRLKRSKDKGFIPNEVSNQTSSEGYNQFVNEFFKNRISQVYIDTMKSSSAQKLISCYKYIRNENAKKFIKDKLYQFKNEDDKIAEYEAKKHADRERIAESEDIEIDPVNPQEPAPNAAAKKGNKNAPVLAKPPSRGAKRSSRNK